MKPLIALALLASLAACGADGPPEPPASKQASPVNISLSGCATVGVSTGPKTTGRAPRC